MKKGDFVEIEFTGKIVITGETFDETKNEPALIVMGAGFTVKGVESQLETMNIGDEREFSVMPDLAFGKRFPELVKILPMKDFIKQKINPEPGIFVTIDNRQAKVQSVSAGRVRVDFNHPLAGRELNYKIKVVRLLSDPVEMSQKYLDHFGIACKCSFSEGKLTVKVPDKMKNLLEKMFSAKMKDLIPQIKEIVFEVDSTEKKTESKNDEHAHEGHVHDHDHVHENHDHAAHASK